MGGTLKGKLRLQGTIVTASGLTIGQDKTGANNTGIPRMIVRHPIKKLPYIPATTFKGALRRVLEKKYYPQGATQKQYKKNYQNCPICQIFGIGGRDLPRTLPARVTFRDALLTDESSEKLIKQNFEAYGTEIKIYANMDRVTSQGNSYAVEQVSAGAHFTFEIFFNIFEKEDLEYFFVLVEGLVDLEIFALGSHGSRGLGKIYFGKWADDGVPGSDDREEGTGLFWRSSDYYCSGADEHCLINAADKLSVTEFLEQKEKITAIVLGGN